MPIASKPRDLNKVPTLAECRGTEYVLRTLQDYAKELRSVIHPLRKLFAGCKASDLSVACRDYIPKSIGHKPVSGC